MKSNSDVRHWNASSVAVLCGMCVALLAPLPARAADQLHRLDAPGPGYREQSARIKTPPDYLRPITEGHPATPRNTFDGEATLRIEPLRRGEFREVPGNLWDAGRGKLDKGNPEKPGALYFEPLPLGEDPIEELPAPPVRGEIRFPEIPEVILPQPAAVDSSMLELTPFAKPLSLELRAAR